MITIFWEMVSLVKIDGFISRQNIRRLLDNYDALQKGDSVLDPDHVAVVNGGPKQQDGVSGSKLNKIMLDDAISKLSPWMQAVVKCKWTRRLATRDALKVLKCSAGVYKNRQGLAIEQIYININGAAAGLAALYEKIDSG